MAKATTRPGFTTRPGYTNKTGTSTAPVRPSGSMARNGAVPPGYDSYNDILWATMGGANAANRPPAAPAAPAPAAPAQAAPNRVPTVASVFRPPQNWVMASTNATMGQPPQPQPQMAQGQQGQMMNPQMQQLFSMLLSQMPGQQNLRPTGFNFNPNYGAGMISGALATQNQAVDNAINSGNNAIVGGPLASVISSTGNDRQTPGLATAQMNQQAHAQGNVRQGMATSDFVVGPNGQMQQFDYRGGAVTPQVADQLLANNPYGVRGTGGQYLGTGGGSGGGGGGGGGGGAGGSGNPLLQNLFNNYQQQMDAANAANEARYVEGKGELTNLRNRSQNDINRLGSQQALDIRKDANRANAAAMATAQARGMGNSTTPAIMQRGVERDKTDALRRVGDDVARQRLDADNLLTTNLTNWIFNKNDNAPDFNQLIDLARLYGESGTGQQQQQGLDTNALLRMLQSGLSGFGGMGFGGVNTQSVYGGMRPR